MGSHENAATQTLTAAIDSMLEARASLETGGHEDLLLLLDAVLLEAGRRLARLGMVDGE